MATSKKAVEISFSDLETGNIVKIWRTAELLNYLQISIATFKRDKILLIKYENDLPFNLAQIGKELNLSRERIRQIQIKAISILRHHQNDMQEYLFD